MFWNEDKEEEKGFKVPDDIVDLSFSIQCKMLPIDHAYALSQAIQGALPWIAEEDAAGIHLIHVAESGNGWFRPQDTSALLHLSKRTRMMLRVPKHRIDDARALDGVVLEVAGHRLEVGAAQIKSLSALSTMFARHVIMPDAQMSEDDFLQYIAGEMRNLGIRINKVMCGKAHDLNTPDGIIHTQSVMVADMDSAPAVTLQQQGIGAGRKLGCGLFLPHRGIKAVKETH